MDAFTPPEAIAGHFKGDDLGTMMPSIPVGEYKEGLNNYLPPSQLNDRVRMTLAQRFRNGAADIKLRGNAAKAEKPRKIRK